MSSIFSHTQCILTSLKNRVQKIEHTVIRHLSPTLQWSLLILLSAATGLLLYAQHVPAGLLLGAMLAGITLSLLGSTVMVHNYYFIAAQSALGCMLASSVNAQIFTTLSENWLIVLLITVSTLVASAIVGWLLIRFSRLPGATGAWGIAPGGASAMVTMSAEYGADMRLVAFIQYLRVLLVISSAALVGHLLSRQGAGSTVAAHDVVWFGPVSLNFFYTLVIMVAGVFLGRYFKIPSGAMLVPMVLGAIGQSTGVMTIEQPQWLLAITYVIIGLTIGLRFDLSVLRLAFRSLPQIVVAIFLLMGFCTLLAVFLTFFAHVDFLTAFLATSPGGLDTVAIIAAGSGAVIPTVITIQTIRLFSVLFFGPIIAKKLARYSRNRDKRLEREARLRNQSL